MLAKVIEDERMLSCNATRFEKKCCSSLVKYTKDADT